MTLDLNQRRALKKAVIIAAGALFAAILQLNFKQFIYLRELIVTQPWRLLTAHWVHVGWMHYFLNLTAFLCLPLIFPKITLRIMLVFMVLVPIFSSLSFYLFYPHIVAYAGFSGVLHGLYAVAALLSWHDKKQRVFALIILIGLFVKLLWEATVGELSTTMQLIGSPILIEAHQLGVLSSLLLLIVMYWLQKKKRLRCWGHR